MEYVPFYFKRYGPFTILPIWDIVFIFKDTLKIPK